MSTRITGISSMATRQVLAELAGAYRQQSGIEVAFESVGGVDAASGCRPVSPSIWWCSPPMRSTS